MCAAEYVRYTHITKIDLQLNAGFSTNKTRKLSLFAAFFSLSQSEHLNFWTIGFIANVQCQLKWDFINLMNNLILNSIHSILDQWRQCCNIMYNTYRYLRPMRVYSYLLRKLRDFINEQNKMLSKSKALKLKRFIECDIVNEKTSRVYNTNI